jgi:hypothetical protein
MDLRGLKIPDMREEVPQEAQVAMTVVVKFQCVAALATNLVPRTVRRNGPFAMLACSRVREKWMLTNVGSFWTISQRSFLALIAGITRRSSAPFTLTSCSEC